MSRLLVIVGETASGKSALALGLAQRFNGEIICADSATVRRGADVGTAKPTAAEQAMVPHHLLDIVGSDERFTVADFKKLAEGAIKDINNRGKLPIMVGGTGLYVDSVLYDYKFGVEGEPDRAEIRPGCLVLGIKIEREELRRRVEKRLDAQIAVGLEGEVRGLAERYGWGCLALKNVGYAQWRDSESVQKARQRITKATLDLAKRQRTWFKRNKSIQWFATPVNMTDVVASVTTYLNT